MALAFVGMVGFAALAIDGGRLYSHKRQAQNAADNAALAAARAMCLEEDFVGAALQLTSENGYNNDGVNNVVTVHNPPTSGPYIGDPEYIEVVIVANFPGTFIQVIRSGGLQVTARAVGRCVLGVGEGFAAVFAMSETCTTTILWSGASGLVNGGLHSNKDIQIMGASNTIAGPASYITEFDDNGVTFVPPPEENPILLDEPLDDPLKLDLADYAPGSDRATDAALLGEYHYRSGHITMNWLKNNGLYDPVTDVITPGLYYATGNITINGNNLIGDGVTFVAEGHVDLVGPSHNFRYYIDDLLVFAGAELPSDGVACNTHVIKQSHSGGVYSGYLYAPHGIINISGSNVTINGGLIAYSIDITGENVTVINPYRDH
jgi:hypothetical protein